METLTWSSFCVILGLALMFAIMKVGLHYMPPPLVDFWMSQGLRYFSTHLLYASFHLIYVFLRYLISVGASVSAVNNDGELAFDLAEGEDMEKLLENEMEKQGMLCY